MSYVTSLCAQSALNNTTYKLGRFKEGIKVISQVLFLLILLGLYKRK
jgi:uncharacterized membrane protein (DUF373 family)